MAIPEDAYRMEDECHICKTNKVEYWTPPGRMSTERDNPRDRYPIVSGEQNPIPPTERCGANCGGFICQDFKCGQCVEEGRECPTLTRFDAQE